MKLLDKTNNKLNTLISILLIFSSRALDIVTTYIYTPNMEKESNKIMVFLGWREGLILQIIFCLFFAYCSYIYHNSTINVIKINTSIKFPSLPKFISLFQYGNSNSILQNSFKKPLTKPFIYSLGFIGTNTLIFVGFFVGTSTLLLINSQSYRTIYSHYKIPVILYILIFFSALYFAFTFYKKEYKKYCLKK